MEPDTHATLRLRNAESGSSSALAITARSGCFAILLVAKRGLLSTAWNSERVQAISQHREACGLLCDPLLFPAAPLEDPA
jgi:hypothetical protein